MRRALLLASLACAALPAWPLPERFTDPQDGELDLSDYLLRHRGVLPVPLVVTEPAVGYGGGVALAYFSQSFEQRAEESRARGEAIVPPDIAVGAAVRTENGTSLGGAGYMGFWD